MSSISLAIIFGVAFFLGYGIGWMRSELEQAQAMNRKAAQRRHKHLQQGVPPIPQNCWLIVRWDGMFSWVMPGDVLPTHWYSSMAAAAYAANKEAAQRREDG